ncbi:hypothetical protein GGS24DRAFT_510168 [Hypoxylon argillaceum]|nr:hypothetical protein GGS24DRAFT_510168 [Hypoxylon argillaceum]KAI1148104.1 hypothetical protein F4825DRAFT_470690 [Nemania diffusa]
MDPNPFTFTTPLLVDSHDQDTTKPSPDPNAPSACAETESLELFFDNLIPSSKDNVSDKPDSDVSMPAYEDEDAEDMNSVNPMSGPRDNSRDTNTPGIEVPKRQDDVDVVMPDAQGVGDLLAGKYSTLVFPSSEEVDMVIDDGRGAAQGVPVASARESPPAWMVSILQPGFVGMLRMQNLKSITLETDKIHFSFE